MFRELQRKKQKLSAEECIRILCEEKRGVLSVIGEDGYPYGMPMNHFYNSEDGKIYFHSGKSGHRCDALKKENKASFCVYDSGYREAGEWALHIKSVIIFGKMEMIEDLEQISKISALLSRKFTADEGYIQAEIEQHARHTLLLALTPEQICGKIVEES